MYEPYCLNEENKLMKSKKYGKFINKDDLKNYIFIVLSLSFFLICNAYGHDYITIPKDNNYIECPSCGFWSWTCEHCGQSNPSLVNTCQRCGRPKDW